MKLTWRKPLTVLGLPFLVGCAAPTPAPVANQDPIRQSMTNPATTGSSNSFRSGAGSPSRLPGADNGLEIRKVTVADQPDRFLSTIARSMHGSAVDPDTQLRLERNGLRMIRVPVDDVDQLLIDLGGASLDLNEWHGQAIDWRPLQQRSIGSAPRAIAIDGSVYRYQGGRMAFNLRAWTIQMEDGPCVHLEMLPRFESDRSAEHRSLMPGRREIQVEAYPSMALDMQLSPGFAYVLFGEAPQTRWPDSMPADELPEPAPAQTRRNTGPLDVTADEGSAPVTFGEFMLVGDRQPVMRGLIVFIPRIAPELFPPDLSPITPTVPATVVDKKPATKDPSQVSRKKGGGA